MEEGIISEAEVIRGIYEKIEDKNKILVEQFKAILEKILDAKVVTKKSPYSKKSSFFLNRTICTMWILEDIESAIKYYRLGDPGEPGYDQRIRDISNFKEKAEEFLEDVIKEYGNFFTSKKLIELSKYFEKKAFEKS